MKVLLLVHGYPPDQQAGAELYAAHTARGLLARGADVVAVAPGHRADGTPEGSSWDEVHAGVRVIRLQRTYATLDALEGTYCDPTMTEAVDAIVARERPDVMHVHHIAGTSADAIPRAKRLGVPVVVTLHDFWFQCARGQRHMPSGTVCHTIDPRRCARCIAPKSLAYAANAVRREPLALLRSVADRLSAEPLRRRTQHMRDALNQADRILAPSQFLRDEFIRWGIPEERISWSEYGIDPTPWSASPSVARPDGPLRFGFVGHLLPTKGIDVLVRAFQGVPEGRATLDVFGGAPPRFERFARQMRARNHHPGVRFHGPFDHDDIAATFERFDVLVVPSTWFENAPLTLYESVLAGKSVITSDLGGMREFAEQFGTARTVSPGDVEALRRALLETVEAGPEALTTVQPTRAVRRVNEDVEALWALYESLTLR